MPRANRYFMPEHVWHITYRCHQHYVEGVMEQLGIKATGRSVYHEAGLCQVKEPEYAYKPHYDGKMGALSKNKGSFSWE